MAAVLDALFHNEKWDDDYRLPFLYAEGSPYMLFFYVLLTSSSYSDAVILQCRKNETYPSNVGKRNFNSKGRRPILYSHAK